MTQTDAPEATLLVGRIVRAQVAQPLAELLRANANKIARRVPGIQVQVTVGSPFDGGWCFAHRNTMRLETDRTGQPLLHTNCGWGSADDPCVIRPTQLAELEASATGLPLVDGDLRIVGVLVTDSNGVTTATSLDEEFRAEQHLALAGSCDHCGTVRDRNYTLLMHDSNPLGTVRALGSSCARELTGGAVRDGLIKLMVTLREAMEQIATGGRTEGSSVPTLDVVALANLVIRRNGFIRTGAGTKHRASTRDTVYQALVWDGKTPRPAILLSDLTEADLDAAQAAIDELQVWDEDSSFAVNLRQIVAADAMEIDGRRSRLGMAVCIPQAAERAIMRRIEQQEREAAWAAEAQQARPVPAGRHLITGEIIKVDPRYDPYKDATILKLTIKTDGGYKIWGNCPGTLDRDPERGDRIQFKATLTPSDDDPTFGFYKIPKNAELLTGTN